MISSPFTNPYQKNSESDTLQTQIIHLKKNYDDYILRIKKLQNTISNLKGELNCLQPKKPPKRQVFGESRYQTARLKCQQVQEKISASDYLIKTYQNLLEQYGYQVQDDAIFRDISIDPSEYDSLNSNDEYDNTEAYYQNSIQKTNLPILKPIKSEINYAMTSKAMPLDRKSVV